MSERIVMGYWDCPYCGSTGIEGTTYDCPNCGHQRGKDEHVYLSKNKIAYKPGERVKDAKYIKDYKFKGVDWYCDYCNALNSAENTVCENCGSHRMGKNKTAFDFEDVEKTPLPVITRKLWECPNCESLNESTEEVCHSCGTPRNEKSASKKETPSFEKEPERKPEKERKTEIIKSIKKFCKSELGRNITVALIAILLVFLLFKGLVYIFKPHPKTLEVTDTTWERNIDIQSYETVREDDWSVPSGGRVQYTRNEIHHYNKVIDHYETVFKTRTVESGGHYDVSYSYNGDGTYTERTNYVPDYKTETYTEQEPVYKNVPVYRTKYYYDIEKWIHKRYVTTNGHDKNVYWGEVVLTDNERENTRTETYKVNAYEKKDKKQKEKTYNISRDMWLEVETNTEINVFTSFDTITSFNNNHGEK